MYRTLELPYVDLLCRRQYRYVDLDLDLDIYCTGAIRFCRLLYVCVVPYM